ncbi:MAG TPA: hypothetical protein VGB44_07685, partial [Flavobacterium sp.]
MKKKYFFTTFLAVLGFAANAQIFVNSSATGANNGSSWANAYTNLQDALLDAPANASIWVKAGTY